MMTVKQIALLILSTFVGIVLAFILNFVILDRILIPDPCYYHTHDTNIIFDIFYDLPASEGFHPFPTKFNFIFTAIIGALIGFKFVKHKLKKRDEQKTTKA